MEQLHPDALYDVDVARVVVAPEGKPFHPDTLYRMAKRGVLPAEKVGPRGGRTVWRGKTLIDYIRGED